MVAKTPPRLTVQMTSTATPTTAMRPILMAVRLAGGATRPERRRPDARIHIIVPNPTTTTARITQLTTGSMLPWTRL
jgi:hypothetical protein